MISSFSLTWPDERALRFETPHFFGQHSSRFTRDDSPLLFTLDGKSRLSTYRAQGERWQHVGVGTDHPLMSPKWTIEETAVRAMERAGWSTGR